MTTDNFFVKFKVPPRETQTSAPERPVTSNIVERSAPKQAFVAQRKADSTAFTVPNSRYSELAKEVSNLIARESDLRDAIAAVPNFWDVIHYGDGKLETRYSMMLNWLLNPKADHGLGTRVADAILENAGFPGWKLSPDAHVLEKEWYFIDILIIDKKQKRLIAIENKTAIEEHEWRETGFSQLLGYRWTLGQGEGFAVELPQLTTMFSGVAYPEKCEHGGRHPAKSSYHDKECDFKFTQGIVESARLDAKKRGWGDLSEYEAAFIFLSPHSDPKPSEITSDPQWHSFRYSDLGPILYELLTDGTFDRIPNGAHVKKIVEDFYYHQKRLFAGKVDGAIAGLYFKDEDINTPVRDRERNFAPEIVKLADELGLLSDSEDSSRLSPIEQFYLDLTPANTDGEESLSSFQNAMGLTEPQTKKLIEYIWAHKPRIGDGAPVREEARNLYRDCQQEICGAVSASPIAAKPQYQQLGIHSVKIGNPNAGAGNNNIILYIDGPGEESAWYKNKAVKANFVLDAAKTGDTVSFGGNTAPFAAKSMNDINNSNVATKWHLRFAQALFAKSGKRFFPGTNADKSLTYESGAELANAILAVLKDWNANGTFATCKQEYLADKTAKQSFA